jgi:CelD/BcsL family acetyltransferase involved in cellulose biosynthesis
VSAATPVLAYENEDVPTVVERVGVAHLEELSPDLRPDLGLTIYTELAAIEREWRYFQEVADCTAFQAFDWLAAWHRHLGEPNGVIPVIAVGTYSNGETAFIMPLAVTDGRMARRLCWLGQEQSDYNAPLLARDFSLRITTERFGAAWRELCEFIRRDPQLCYDWIEFEKMPEIVGAQANPFVRLGAEPNASSAHLMRLGDDWDKFYAAKRSSATRRHDRAKRRHMSQFGEVRFVSCSEPDDTRRTLDALMDQKSRIFARRGIRGLFTRPGLREFFLDLASDPKTRQLCHVSRVEVGDSLAATNFALVFGDCYYHVLATYDDRAATAQYGPGALHLRELLAYAIKRKLARFDFTIGDEPYKKEWSDVVLKLCDYSAAVTWRGWIADAIAVRLRRLKRFIKQTPWAWRLMVELRTVSADLEAIPSTITEFSRRLERAFRSILPRA